MYMYNVCVPVLPFPAVKINSSQSDFHSCSKRIQVHLNKLECRGKVHLSNSTQIVKLVLNKFNAHRLKKFKSLVLLIVMI